MSGIKKEANLAMKKIIELMNSRLGAAISASDAEGSVQIVKNDELIKFANFIVDISESETQKSADVDADIRFVLSEELEKWAK